LPTVPDVILSPIIGTFTVSSSCRGDLPASTSSDSAAAAGEGEAGVEREGCFVVAEEGTVDAVGAFAFSFETLEAASSVDDPLDDDCWLVVAVAEVSIL
jgi:uncharacterized membrane protein